MCDRDIVSSGKRHTRVIRVNY